MRTAGTSLGLHIHQSVLTRFTFLLPYVQNEDNDKPFQHVLNLTCLINMIFRAHYSLLVKRCQREEDKTTTCSYSASSVLLFKMVSQAISSHLGCEWYETYVLKDQFDGFPRKSWGKTWFDKKCWNVLSSARRNEDEYLYISISGTGSQHSWV